MNKVYVRNFDGVLNEFETVEIDHIKVVRYFDVDNFTEYSKPHIVCKKCFDSVPKSGRILEVYRYTKDIAEMYFYNADNVWVTFD